jgi:hypothetical protein
MRVTAIGNPQPYQFFGTFAGLSFWPGGLSLLAAAPGIGKTSWLLRMVFEAARQGFPAALGCYEHTSEELKYRLHLQGEAATAGAHSLSPAPEQVEALLAQGGQAVLLALSDQDDTVRAIEETLIQDYNFPVRGPALLAMDYLQRVPVVGVTGLVSEEKRGGEAAALLRALARRHGWAVIAASAMRAETFTLSSGKGFDLSALLGDERIAYEPDRVLLVERKVVAPLATIEHKEAQPCGCTPLEVHTLKDRTGPVRNWPMSFWGARFYPALPEEDSEYSHAGSY